MPEINWRKRIADPGIGSVWPCPECWSEMVGIIASIDDDELELVCADCIHEWTVSPTSPLRSR